jgi:hypothetical protein
VLTGALHLSPFFTGRGRIASATRSVVRCNPGEGQALCQLLLPETADPRAPHPNPLPASAGARGEPRKPHVLTSPAASPAASATHLPDPPARDAGDSARAGRNAPRHNCRAKKPEGAAARNAGEKRKASILPVEGDPLRGPPPGAHSDYRLQIAPMGLLSKTAVQTSR